MRKAKAGEPLTFDMQISDVTASHSRYFRLARRLQGFKDGYHIDLDIRKDARFDSAGRLADVGEHEFAPIIPPHFELLVTGIDDPVFFHARGGVDILLVAQVVVCG